MNKPTKQFKVSVRPVFTVHSCAVQKGQEQRGLFGFHNFESCPDCKVIPKAQTDANRLALYNRGLI